MVSCRLTPRVLLGLAPPHALREDEAAATTMAQTKTVTMAESGVTLSFTLCIHCSHFLSRRSRRRVFADDQEHHYGKQSTRRHALW
jgi:hypothetical protein